MTRRLIVTADDFGADISVNEAVERAHRTGILTAASLMVGGPAAADAVERARRLPRLAVGLHLTLARGRAVSPPDAVPDLVRPDGAFRRDLLAAGIAFFFRPSVRRQVAREIRAQFEAFRRTGLTLDHADAHCHMHLHPTVGRLLVEIGRDFGLAAVRVPVEPPELWGRGAGLGARALVPLAALLRRRLARAGVASAHRVAGLLHSGAMTEAHLLRLLERLPEGVTEIYCHPATRATGALAAAMPGYRGAEELAALVSPAVRAAVAARGATLTSYGRLPASGGAAAAGAYGTARSAGSASSARCRSASTLGRTSRERR